MEKETLGLIILLGVIVGAMSGAIYGINHMETRSRNSFCEEKGFGTWEFETISFTQDKDFYCLSYIGNNNQKNKETENLFVLDEEYQEWRK